MKNNLNEIYDEYKDWDFTDAKPVSQTLPLARLQAQKGNQSPITIQIDNDVLAFFKVRAAMEHEDYHILMSKVLKQFVQTA